MKWFIALLVANLFLGCGTKEESGVSNCDSGEISNVRKLVGPDEASGQCFVHANGGGKYFLRGENPEALDGSVYLSNDSILINSKVGKNARIQNSIVRNTIIGENVVLEHSSIRCNSATIGANSSVVATSFDGFSQAYGGSSYCHELSIAENVTIKNGESKLKRYWLAYSFNIESNVNISDSELAAATVQIGAHSNIAKTSLFLADLTTYYHYFQSLKIGQNTEITNSKFSRPSSMWSLEMTFFDDMKVQDQNIALTDATVLPYGKVTKRRGEE